MANKEKTLEELKVEAELAQKAYAAALKAEEQKKKEEAERKKAELELVKEKRKAEIDEATERCHKLIDAYIKDYGSYYISGTSDDADTLRVLFGSKPWRWFF